MGHVTTQSLQVDNERYAYALQKNNWTLNVNDFLIESLSSDGAAGSMYFETYAPNLTDTSVIYLCSDVINPKRIDIAARNGWRVNKCEVRVLGDNPFIVNVNPKSAYGGGRMLLPKEFVCKFENAQHNIAFKINTQGMLKNHGLSLDCVAKNGKGRFSGFDIGGGGFSGLRLQQPGSDTDASYVNTLEIEVTNGILHDTISEGAYIGSIKKFHTRFVNSKFHNLLFYNLGSEFQLQNISEGSIIENITIVNTGCGYPSPFQNNQFGGIQLKAGGGSFTMRNIYIENAGQPVMNFFGAAPVVDADGKLIQEGCKPGDVYTIDNIVSPKSKGQFLYVHQSCSNGAEWLLDRIYCGGVTKRIAKDTGTTEPYAFLYDVPGAVTDKLTIKSITHDESLQLLGKNGQKYNILAKTIGTIQFAKFVKPVLCTDMLEFFNTYNETTQNQSDPNAWRWPVAGQPVKFKQDDVTFDILDSQPTVWKRVTRDGTSQEDIFEVFQCSSDYHQTLDSPWYNIAGVKQPDEPDTDKPTYEELVAQNIKLKIENMSLSEDLKIATAKAEALEVELEAVKTENTALKIKDAKTVSVINEVIAQLETLTK